MIGRILRAMAVAIAIAAAFDPALTMTARGRSRIAIVADPATDEARAPADRLRGLLRPDFDVAAGPDASADAAVVVGHDYVDAPPPEGQRAFTVTLPPADGDPNVRVSAVRAPRDVPAGTLIPLEIDVDGTNVAGVTSSLAVRTGEPGVEVGRATHAWTAARERWRARLDVVPVDLPPWRLRVEVAAIPNERALADNVADVGVALSEPLRIFVFEPRPSWAVTFVRRALERDARFTVASRTDPSRNVSVTSGEDAALTEAGLEGVRAVIAGGLDRVTPHDGAVLDAFMRQRGGALVLLPDARADVRAVSQRLPISPTAETLLERPARLAVEPPLPAFEVSEILTFGGVPGMRVLARSSSGEPVITAAPVGAGRLIVSGALDAWRYRANDSAAFDRFWQAAIAGAAAASPPAVDVSVVPTVARPGTSVEVQVRLREGTDAVAAALNTGDVVRLWPGAEPGTFHGSFVAPTASGARHIVVTARRATGTARFIVAPRARQARAAGPPLALLAATRGGVDVPADDLTSLVRALQTRVPAPSTTVTRRPMRSVWWMVPFAACLGGEWWLRRRRGNR